MRINSKEIKFLEESKPENIAEWLRNGFEDLFHYEKRSHAFYPLHYLILSWNYENELHALKNVYDVLSGSAKSNFRKGIKIAILNLPKEETYFEILRKLLFLSGMVSSYESIEAILLQVGNGYFGIGNEGEKLFALSLNIIAGMSPAHKVSEAIRSLIGAVNFQYTLAPLAFLGLCQAEPKKFPQHLDLLRKSFSLLHKDKQQLEKSFYTIKRFVKLVDLKTIADNLAKLFIINDPTIEYEETDKWLIDGMFLRQDAPLLKIIEGKNEEFIISLNAVSFPIKIPRDKGDFIQYLKWIEVEQLKRNSQIDKRMREQIIKTIEPPEVHSEVAYA